MGGSPYAISIGRLKSDFPSFLGKDALLQLRRAKGIDEILTQLETTHYGPHINATRATHTGLPLFEIALNRALVHRNHLAWTATPFAGRNAVAEYLRRWDFRNIELILTSKIDGRPLTQVESHLISARGLPAGLVGGILTLDDLRLLLEQPTLEAIAQVLVKFGYGATLLPLIEQFGRSRDIFPLHLALEREYYRRCLDATRYFQGDEWTVRQFLASEIDARNTLVLLKGKALGLPNDKIFGHWVDGGSLARPSAEDLLTAGSVPQLAERLSATYPSLSQAADLYPTTESLTVYEGAIRRDRARRELQRLRSYPLSMGIVLAYLLMAELEWNDLRQIGFAQVYGIPDERLDPLLVLPHL
jgi:vacuolar-type H+-ATPase subunit C/Vma6